MDRETKTIQKNNFVDAHFVVGKSASLSIGIRKRMMVLFGNWNLFLKPLNKTQKGHVKELKKRMELAMA